MFVKSQDFETQEQAKKFFDGAFIVKDKVDTPIEKFTLKGFFKGRFTGLAFALFYTATMIFMTYILLEGIKI